MYGEIVASVGHVTWDKVRQERLRPCYASEDLGYENSGPNPSGVNVSSAAFLLFRRQILPVLIIVLLRRLISLK